MEQEALFMNMISDLRIVVETLRLLRVAAWTRVMLRSGDIRGGGDIVFFW